MVDCALIGPKGGKLDGDGAAIPAAILIPGGVCFLASVFLGGSDFLERNGNVTRYFERHFN